MFAQPFPHMGEILSLATAVIWAAAVIFYKKSGETTSPLALNLFKNCLGLTLFLLTLAVIGEPTLPNVSWKKYVWVAISGAIGIGVADMIFLKSLNLLGAGRTAVVESMYSPFVIVLSFFWLDERLRALQLIGASIIVLAVIASSYERTKDKINRGRLWKGLLIGIFSHFLMALGMVMIKPVLDNEPLLWTITWRLVGGVVVLVIITMLHPHRHEALKTLRAAGGLRWTFLGSFFGAYLVLITWLGGMKYTQASTASVLNQVSAVLTFALAAVFLKESVTRRKVVALTMAIGGVFLVTFG